MNAVKTTLIVIATLIGLIVGLLVLGQAAGSVIMVNEKAATSTVKPKREHGLVHLPSGKVKWEEEVTKKDRKAYCAIAENQEHAWICGSDADKWVK